MTKVKKSDQEWREQLSDMEYYVTREHGTERAGTGPHLDEKREGKFTCICCGKELFPSHSKYESGTGWPSFYEPVSKEAVNEFEDRKLFRTRIEVRCSDCDAHLGHVFPDGPQPTGSRYCMNGHALGFKPKEDDKA